ncbi:glycoside hydrolase family 5 protein [Flavobacterium johnsoniae]|uniref:Candidate endoglucanase Glycoside hydrolase family 5 n=1 Tax=Flavobacterium johnsoniae (strain ATCC 17061 / DSM 2064 / JCM 8514 / BCRC 14874 / CCUG 350202 / NBRC 14942 / NCIMB 11054 / UW101) TaxID=376686 RepID=A5FA24_FLAJ1|nr:glycoside hydrolase family 5 protein [Flavobacterium johnsoniae]ABQ07945.1 Candidate endoglucanase; Glycoside hydrolase family 5 [Flavobacterium johnsoniae UW101]OXG02023.1 glycosyl hydrolase family 5 [Flavobacterium johnsoniae UW101]WQG80210.1 glycoside hydrolase family 5 protein [Flavobacterium johnsoniae UW101]SHK96904.1 endoglucanase [Flavobacterium johnsoniae]
MIKLKKNLITAALLLICCFSQAQFVKEHGQLSVLGIQLVDQNNQPIVLRGLSFGWHSMWPRFYNEKAVSWLKKDFKCNVVRAAMGIELGEYSYIKDPKFSKEKIEAVVNGAIKSDIYVIIDWHSHNINLKEAKEFFAEMSKKYAKYPNIIYEIFNEPDYETWWEVKTYSEEVIRVIRENDPNNIILVGSPHWDQDVDLPAEDPILGYNNIMYTMHFYAATHGKDLRDKTDEAIKRGLPIFISESAGMEASGDGPLNVKAWQEYIDWMEAKKLSWITWSVSDKDETCSILKKSAKSEGKWKDEDLKESGIEVREFLRKYNNQE